MLDAETNTYHRYPIHYAVEQGWVSPSYLDQNAFHSERSNLDDAENGQSQLPPSGSQKTINKTDWTKMSISELRNMNSDFKDYNYDIDSNSIDSDGSLEDEDINNSDFSHPLTPSIVPPLRLGNTITTNDRDQLKMPVNSKYGLKGGSKNSDTCSSSSCLEPPFIQNEILPSQPAYSTNSPVGQLFIDINASPAYHSKTNSLLSPTKLLVDNSNLTNIDSKKSLDITSDPNNFLRPNSNIKSAEISSPSLLVISPLNESLMNGDKTTKYCYFYLQL